MPKSILDTDRNLVRLYLHHTGDSEIPAEFNLWSCLSLIAACVADRVWIEKHRGKKLTPNLYVALIGPSAVGKGEAIDTALTFVRDNPRVNVYAGKATPQHLVARMGKPRRDEQGRLILENAKMFLVTPELSMALGKGEQADSLVKHMTELYTGRDYPFRDGTVTRGEVTVKGYCINWLAGTTKEWLIDCVPKEAISGGFFGRMVAVPGKYDFGKRLVRPIYPPDYDQVVDHLRERIEILTHIEGEVHMSAKAREVEDRWYNERPSPSDESLAPAWKRQHDLLLKLAMILALASPECVPEQLVIRSGHVLQAQRLCQSALKVMPELMIAAAETQDTAGLAAVSTYLRRMKQVQHSTLLRYVSTKGLNAEKMRLVIETLVQAKYVRRVSSSRGMAYVWADRRRMPVDKITRVENEDE